MQAYNPESQLDAINKSIALWEFITRVRFKDSLNPVYLQKSLAYRKVFNGSYGDDSHGCPLCEFTTYTGAGCISCPSFIEWKELADTSSNHTPCERNGAPWHSYINLIRGSSDFNTTSAARSLLKLLIRSRERIINERTYTKYVELVIGIGYNARKNTN